MRRGSERGIVLPLALLALLVIGALVSSAFAAAYVEQRVGGNTLYAAQAAGAAEAGVASVVGAWEAQGLELLAVGGRVVLPTVAWPGSSAYSPVVRRLGDRLFLVEVEGVRLDADAAPLARSRLGLVLRTSGDTTGGPPVSPLGQRAWVP